MELTQSHIQVTSNSAECHGVVLRTTRLEELSRTCELQSLPYFVVIDDDRTFMGIVEACDVLRRLSAANEIEQRKWREMPVEALLQIRFDGMQTPRDAASNTEHREISCTALADGANIVALLGDDDVFVNWRMIQEKVRHTLVDPVTLLPTRAVFEHRLQEEFARARRYGTSLSVMLIDIDYFKEINDSFGHSVGDTMLHRLADTIRQNLRSYDFVARYGGDEFIAILNGCEPDCIDIPIRRVQHGVNAACQGTTLPMPRVTFSIGAAVIHCIDPHQSIADLVELADMCLYQAKEAGRDCAFKIEIAGSSVSPEPSLIETTGRSLVQQTLE